MKAVDLLDCGVGNVKRAGAQKTERNNREFQISIGYDGITPLFGIEAFSSLKFSIRLRGDCR
jgi:hypothetical protein